MLLAFLVAWIAFFGWSGQTLAQPEQDVADASEAPARVEIQPSARDEEIQMRLYGILEATGWFSEEQVRVEDGVVFLQGETETTEFKKWAGDLARNTQDVAAVVNQISVAKPSIWDFQPALAGLRQLWVDVVIVLPLFALSLAILVAFWGAARLGAAATRTFTRRRLLAPLLIDVAARGVGALIFILGMYVVFYVAGLTAVAFTVIGGTGVLGLVLGIAFRGITENFLASIFLSLHPPFRTGDLVEIGQFTGYVQRLTTRATVLMTLEGNHVQIPNSTVNRSEIRNYTSNPNRREDFLIGIGYVESIPNAQDIALKVLADHPAVLADPEPWVLVESLGKATVNLRVYFWLDGRQHSWLKVKSSVMRLTKRAYQVAQVSMPDEARELVFPEGIPVQIFQSDSAESQERRTPRPFAPHAAQEVAAVTTVAEAGLSSEADLIQNQARRSRIPEEGENLLEPSSGDPPTHPGGPSQKRHPEPREGVDS